MRFESLLCHASQQQAREEWPRTKVLGGCGKSRLDPGPWLCFPLSTTQQGCSHPSSSQKYQISTSKKAGALIQSLGSLDHSPATVLFPEGQTSTGLSIPPLPWPTPTLLPGQPRPLRLQLGREPRLVTFAPGCLPIFPGPDYFKPPLRPHQAVPSVISYTQSPPC